PLDEAVVEAPGTFPPYYRCMVKAGAASGNLPAMLSAVARNTEGVRMARRALLEALMYPLVIVLMALLLWALALSVFVPFYRDLCDHLRFDSPIGLHLFLASFASTGKI